MADDFQSAGVPSYGAITTGVQKNTLVERTLAFVRDQLPLWRDDPTRPHEEAEERLNAQVCKFLNVASRQDFPMVHFHHEEKQGPFRRVDLSANPVPQFTGAMYRSIYDPFLVFESKRLPAPKGQPQREKEYVTGGKLRSGGIQRFKLGLHGADHEVAAMIGYLQAGTVVDWFAHINEWIGELSRVVPPEEESWTSDEQLNGLVTDTFRRAASADSTHPRIAGSSIRLRHLWIELSPPG